MSYTVKITLTNRCNAKCVTCLAHSIVGSRGDMTYERFAQLVGILAQRNDINCVSMSNIGEAYLLPDFPRYATLAKAALRAPVIVTTNGHLITEVPPVNTFIISMNGGPETYQQTTGLPFEPLVAKLRSLQAAGQLAKPDHVEVHYLLMGSNRREVCRTREIIRSISPGILFRVSTKFDNQRGLVSYDGICLEGARRIPCSYLLDKVNVHWNGDCILCAHDFEGSVVFGNVFEQPLDEILANPFRRELIAGHRAGDFSGFCERCNFNVPIEGRILYLI